MNAKATVFFSWQSDIRAAAGRSLIEQALEGAAKAIAADDSIAVEPVIDRDTAGVPGAPDIGATILAKIETASVFVADVTIVGTVGSAKPTPNPNVLIELGYALKALGWARILLVQNTFFGAPEVLPFDLRQKRAIGFHSPPEAEERVSERRALQGKFEAALRAALVVAAPPAVVDLSIAYNTKRIAALHHDYELVITLKNVGTKRLDDWEIEIEFPTPLLDGTIYAMKVDERSGPDVTVFRYVGPRIKKALRPGDAQVIRIGYFVNDAIYRRRDELFGFVARARVLVDGEIVVMKERAIAEMQNF